MKTKFLFTHVLAYLLVTSVISGCSYIPWFGDEEEVEIELREPAELSEITPEVQLQRDWQVSGNSDAKEKYVRLQPLFFADKVAFADTKAQVSVYEVTTGKTLWSRKLSGKLSGGVGGNSQALVVGTTNGDVTALRSEDGSDAWNIPLTSEVMAISEALEDIVVVRTNDSRFHGISITTGEVQWVVTQSSPALTLRGVGQPIIRDGVVYAGLDNGKVIAISISSGNVIWESRVSVPSGRSELDRIVDIDGRLAVDNEFLYAVSFHGRLVALDRNNGRAVWARELASVAGLSIDDELVYVTDLDDAVWALQKDTGITVWKQNKLFYRELSVPVNLQDTIIVGDYQGYLHVMAKEDGRLIGRATMGKDPIQIPSSPSSAVSYIVDSSGRLAAYTITSAN